MISNRSFTIISFALISAIVFLITAKRLDQATIEAGRVSPGPYTPHAATGALAPSPSIEVVEKVTTETAVATVTITKKYTLPAPPAKTVYVEKPVEENFSDKGDGSQAPLQKGRDPACEGFPDTKNILLAVKTGATEAFDRLPVQLMTTLKCLPDFLLFSDLEQHIGGHRVRDSLDAVLPEAQEGNSDFDLYRLQKECAVDQDSCVKQLESPADAAWKLDKYKNIHMAEKSYKMHPDKDWYIFVDADTYVSWPNMVYGLSQLDPKKEHLLGVPTVIGSRLFAHGGSGYIVSQASMKEMIGKNPGIANRYDVEMQHNCCGDFMFSQVLNETTGVLVEGFWPLSSGEKPYTVPFGSNTWCHPVGMMHHMNSEEISSFWDLERRHYQKSQKPLLYSEVFAQLVRPQLRDRRDDWDNHSDDWYYIDLERKDHKWEKWRVDKSPKPEDRSEAESVAHRGPDECRAACDERPECFQWSWSDESCAMKRTFRMGKPVRRGDDDKKRVFSGWNLGRIEKWTSGNAPCDDRVGWPALVSKELERKEKEEQEERDKKDRQEKERKEKEQKEEERQRGKDRSADGDEDASKADDA